MTSTAAVDIADASTWPAPLDGLIEELCERVRPLTDTAEDFPACDLAVEDVDFAEYAESRVRDVLAGHLVVVGHATRLLPHEVDNIRAAGVSTLDEELIERKLANAVARCPEAISDADVELLRRSGPLTWPGTADVRLSHLFVFAPLALATENPSGLRPLLRNWGGEAIGWTEDSRAQNRPAGDIIDRLSAMSVPTLLELAAPIDEIPTYRNVWPSLVGRRLGLSHASFEFALLEPVPPERVLDVIQPGHTRWPAGLVRSGDVGSR